MVGRTPRSAADAPVGRHSPLRVGSRGTRAYLGVRPTILS